MSDRVQKKRVSKNAQSDERKIYVQIFEGGRRYETYSSIKMDLRKPWKKPNPQEIRSTIPGSVLSFLVMEGDEVKKNQELMVYEAMKMHNKICAPFDGVVEQIGVKCGDKLQKGALMMVIKASEPQDSVGSGVSDLYLEDFG
ncbi:MAG: acetyl-CoA carboxylase biotin carboxyl carrier protein subunit [Bacteroidales bacterium]|nr:acetyl-CoA carboxylase biotin carboxyl carrier protein subunit [Bacteroidales bacterium]